MTNLLMNAQFEDDLNADKRPDGWSKATSFTRASGGHSGSYQGRFRATDNSNATVSQKIHSITGGALYHTGCWVKIPTTADALGFKLQVRWLDAAGATILT